MSTATTTNNDAALVSSSPNNNKNSNNNNKWPPFNPFVRHPTSPLATFLMYVTGSVLIPIRLLIGLGTLLFLWIWATVGTIGISDVSQPYSSQRKFWLLGGFRFGARMLLFSTGYLWIQEKTIKSSSSSAQTNNNTAAASVVVCNHIGFVELLYLIYRDGCCFVSKADNKKIPVIGKVAQVMQCIFVERGTNGATNTYEKIKERLEAPVGLWPPLTIAPEGTTTTGHVMIHFRTGAFRPGKPVLPIAVETPFSPTIGYDPSFSCANLGLHIVLLMSQPMNFLKITRLDVYSPNKEETENAQLFANNVRQVIANAIQCPIYEQLQWVDKLCYEPSEKAKELGRTLLMKQNGGVMPPPPIFTEDAFGNPLNNNKKKVQ